MQLSLVNLIGYLGASAQRSKILAVGAIVPESLRSQFRCQHVAVRLEEAPDNLTLIDIADLSDVELIELAGSDCIVVCKTIDKLEEVTRSRILSAAVHWFEQNALIIHFSPESDRPNILEPEVLDAFGQQVGFSPLHLGVLPANNSNEERQVVALYDREVQDALKVSGQTLPPPLAILSAFNEEDVIKEVVEDLLEQGCELVVLDNWSTDGTWEILRKLQHISPSRLSVERFPTSPVVRSSWVDILARKEEIALQHAGRWILHSDADELRRSPFEGVSLARAMHMAQITGATRINFTVLNFCPVDAGPYVPGTLESAFKYFQFGSTPVDFEQRKAWLQGSDRVNLRRIGGHCADFKNAVDFRYRFWLKHFPVRSISHGRIKIYHHRMQRWSKAEQDGGWHGHYNNISQDNSFVWPAEQLHEYRGNTFHKIYGLTIMTRIAERSQVERERSAAVQPFLWRSHAIDEQYELIKAKLTEAEGQIRNINLQIAKQAELLKQLIAAEARMKESTLELAALRNSTSWQLTAPIRSMIARFPSFYRLTKKFVQSCRSLLKGAKHIVRQHLLDKMV
jgi:glycosyltransferase involved in cell wall biosynthesis